MFENLKTKLLDRIERDAVKSEMTYRPTKDAEPITETVYIKRSKLPIIGDWARIYPPVNEDGTWNLTNLIFGGKKNLIKLLFVAGLIMIVFLGYKEILNYTEILKATCIQPINLA